MNNPNVNVLVDMTVNLKEADELLTISHNLFQRRLSLLETYIRYLKSDEEKKQLHEKADQAYREYKNTVKEIDTFIKFISLLKQGTYEQRTI